MLARMTREKKANANLNRWKDHPVQFVREVFDVAPDPWQVEVLEAFPNHQRLAMKACKGPGKTAVEAWLAWNFLLTRIEPKVAAVSVTAENLADNLWSEMAKWQQRSALLKQRFEWTKTRIFLGDTKTESPGCNRSDSNRSRERST